MPSLTSGKYKNKETTYTGMFDLSLVYAFVDKTAEKIISDGNHNVQTIGYILDAYYILNRKPSAEFITYAFDVIDAAQLVNGLWSYQEFHYIPNSMRIWLTYRNYNKTPPNAINNSIYTSLNTFTKVYDDILIYEDSGTSILVWGGLWGYITLFQLGTGSNPSWLSDYITFTENNKDRWINKNHERNHMAISFHQFCQNPPYEEEIISTIVNEQNNNGGWGAEPGDPSNSTESSHTIFVLSKLGYNKINVINKTIKGILTDCYTSTVINGTLTNAWSYHQGETVNVSSTTIACMLLAELKRTVGNNNPYYVKVC